MQVRKQWVSSIVVSISEFDGFRQEVYKSSRADRMSLGYLVSILMQIYKKSQFLMEGL